MGFSLVGNSGDSTQTTTVRNFSASINPQLEGSAPGDFNINLSPVSEGGSSYIGSPQIDSYYAPIAVTSTGDNLGDAALNALQSLVSTTTASVTPGTPGTVATGATTSINSTTIYLALAAVILLFLAHE